MSAQSIQFTQDDLSTVEFKHDGQSISIHDSKDAWKDWYFLTETQAHDLKCWLEKTLNPLPHKTGGRDE